MKYGGDLGRKMTKHVRKTVQKQQEKAGIVFVKDPITGKVSGTKAQSSAEYTTKFCRSVFRSWGEGMA